MPTLSWLTREDDVRAVQSVPYRLLEETPGLSAGEADAGNMLIQDDNLEALKALLPFYAGRIKCIYIDPPYNTRSAFEHETSAVHAQRQAAPWRPRFRHRTALSAIQAPASAGRAPGARANIQLARNVFARPTFTVFILRISDTSR